jgi:hypothetical protein
LFDGPPERELEVIAGFGRMNYLTALGRIGSDEEVYDVLSAETTDEARTYRARRADRPRLMRNGEPNGRLHAPERPTEYLHGPIPPHVLLALRWAPSRGLKPPTDVLKENLKHTAKEFAKHYGLRVVANLWHPANPFTGGEWGKLGWLTSNLNELSQKYGGWNPHHQMYCCRITGGQFVCKHRSFRYAGNVMISALWLKSYGVNMHYVSRTAKEHRLRRDYNLKRESLPERLALRVSAGKITKTEAINLAVASAMTAWDNNWKSGTISTNAGARLRYLLIEKSQVQIPADWFLSVRATEDLERRLIDLDRGYEALLEKGRRVYALIKMQQCKEGYKRPLNRILAEFEQAEDAAEEKGRREAKNRRKRQVRKVKEDLALEAMALAEGQQARIAQLEATNAVLTKRDEERPAALLVDLKEAANQKMELSRLVTANDRLIEAGRGQEQALSAAREAEVMQRQAVAALRQENAALRAMVPSPDQLPMPYTPAFLMAALSEGNAVAEKLADLSTLSEQGQRVVGITPAGQVGLTTDAHQFVLVMIKWLKQDAVDAKDDGREQTLAHRNLLTGFEGALKAHNASIALTRDWEAIHAGLERVVLGRPRANDKYFQDRKWGVLAEKAAAHGSIPASEFLRAHRAYQKHLRDLSIAPDPKSKADADERGRDGPSS